MTGQFLRIVKNTYRVLIMVTGLFTISCGAPNNAFLDDKNRREPFHVIISIKQENDAVNETMALFTAVQKPDNIRVYFPETLRNATVLDYKWKEMKKIDIEKLKKYCDRLPEKINVEYE